MPYVDGKYITKREWMEQYSRLQTLSRVDGPPGSRPPAPIEEEAAPAPKKRTAKSASKAAAKATGVKLPDGISPVPGGEPVKVAEAGKKSAHIDDSDPVEVDDNGIPLT